MSDMVSFDYEENPKQQKRVPKRKKQVGNLSFNERLVDLWYRFLERTFAPGCYYIGQDVKIPDYPKTKDIDCPSQITITSEKKNASFGLDIELFLRSGSVFRDAVETRKILWKTLVFFKPIPIANSSVRIALGRRCFIENDTIVIQGPTQDYTASYALNVPGDIADVLRIIEIGFLNKRESISCQRLGYGVGTTAGKMVRWEIEEGKDGTSNLKIIVDDSNKKVMPNIIDADEDSGVLDEKKAYVTRPSTRIVDGIQITSGEKASLVRATIGTLRKPLVHTILTLPTGSDTMTLHTEDVKLVVSALKAFNNLGPMVSSQGSEMDELYRGKDAIYLKWHRGWSNSKGKGDHHG